MMFNFDENTEFISNEVYSFRYNVRNVEGILVCNDNKISSPNAVVMLLWIKRNGGKNSYYDVCYQDLMGVQSLVSFISLESLNKAIISCFVPSKESIGAINYRRWLKRCKAKSI